MGTVTYFTIMSTIIWVIEEVGYSY